MTKHTKIKPEDTRPELSKEGLEGVHILRHLDFVGLRRTRESGEIAALAALFKNVPASEEWSDAIVNMDNPSNKPHNAIREFFECTADTLNYIKQPQSLHFTGSLSHVGTHEKAKKTVTEIIEKLQDEVRLHYPKISSQIEQTLLEAGEPLGKYTGRR